MATGITSGSFRLVPDISLNSSPNNAGYLYCSSDSQSAGISGSCANGFRDSNSTYLTVADGTSFAAPIFAGILAIVNQKLNSTGQGVVNSTLYILAANSTTYASAFHDITSGGNQCTAGSTYCSGAGSSQYAAATGYDEASGLGSLDFYNALRMADEHARIDAGGFYDHAFGGDCVSVIGRKRCHYHQSGSGFQFGHRDAHGNPHQASRPGAVSAR